MQQPPQQEEFDVLIVGAGLSGVGAAYHLTHRCPGKSFVILEGRDAIGGTWDLFRYPGVRSDSDMFTLGYAFKPWKEQKAVADGPSILKYIRETAAENGIDRHIRFRHKVKRMSWSSEDARWNIEAEHDGAARRFRAKFIICGAGYYNYEHGYLPDFKGMDRFKGQVIHPQKWPEELDYAGKRVVVIGSGATAVTLIPAMTDKAAHVTMVQRSPTYMISAPAVDPIANKLRELLPPQLAYHTTRFIKTTLQQFFFRRTRSRPQEVRNWLLDQIRAQLGPEYVEAHFTPRYNPWDERLCLVPDNDLFLAIKSGKASVVTDQIETFTEKGLKLASGQELEADIIVTATGLVLQMFGGAEVVVDGRKIESGELHVYRGAMYTGVPNFANVFGYTNASWTLKADLICEYVCRVLNYMDEYGLVQCTPRDPGPDIEDRPFVDFTSGYFKRASHMLPKQAAVAPWTLNQNYRKDMRELRHGQIEDGVLQFRSARQAAPAAAQAQRELA